MSRPALAAADALGGPSTPLPASSSAWSRLQQQSHRGWAGAAGAADGSHDDFKPQLHGAPKDVREFITKARDAAAGSPVPCSPFRHIDAGPSSLSHSKLPRTVLQQDIRTNKVMVYMKGTPSAPQCGFSKRVVDILSELAHDLSSSHF